MTKRESKGTQGVPKRQKVESQGVDERRVRDLNEAKEAENGPILYWMSRDQRAHDNWALLYALQWAKQQDSAAAVVFNLTPTFLEATLRQYQFMLDGLKEVEKDLHEHNIPFFVTLGDPAKTIPKLVEEYKFSGIVCDFSPLRIGKEWKKKLVKAVSVPVKEVDAHNIVPVWEASDKIEYAARTIRPKIHRQLHLYLTDFPALEKQIKSEKDKLLAGAEGSIAASMLPATGTRGMGVDWSAVWKSVKVDRSVAPVDWAKPGPRAGLKALKSFLTKTRLSKYSTGRNDPNANALSGLSPYFHFGQLAPQRAAFEANSVRSLHKESVDAFIEESVVRRELAENYCFYNSRYDDLHGLYPQYKNRSWAQKSLAEHKDDKRSHVYTYEELEAGKSHDDLWNASQWELLYTGKMHGFMRMYWAKKILEWTESPEQALKFAIKLNDRYELDGRDPNGYVGCAWSIAGVHDQGWKERPVFGKIRFMSYDGCKRKFDIASYISRMKSIMLKIKKQY